MAAALPDWRSTLLRIAKDSLRDPFDKECCEQMCFLPEFKLFILSNYVVGADLVEDA